MSIRTHIRPIERADVPALLEIIRDARAQYGTAARVDALIEPGDFALFESYQKWRSIYFVAVIDGRVVGGAGIAALAGADPLTCELQRMYIAADARGQGVGTKLLEACLDSARRFWFVRCYAEALSQKDPAPTLYARNGFLGMPESDRWLMRTLSAPQEAL
jgi:putative acetyltransferase